MKSSLSGLSLGIAATIAFVAGCGTHDAGGFGPAPSTFADASVPPGSVTPTNPNEGTFGSSAGDAGSQPNSTAPGCKNLQCKQQHQCPGGAKTTLSGTVYDPAGQNPLYNVVVYVPNTKPAALVNGASCDSCNSLYTGEPVATTLSGPDGKFVLENVPVGSDIPVVIQVGKWRRQVTIKTTTLCADTHIDDKDTFRLPRNRSEGDIPHFAVSTGGADSIECLFRRIGIDESEFASTGGDERVQIFHGVGGATLQGGSSESQTALWSDVASLSKYDVVILSCEGAENPDTKPPASLLALRDYANAGGRVFASHYHYYWFEKGPDPFPSTATWTPSAQAIGNIGGAIDTSFPKGVAFNEWLKTTGALSPDGTLAISEAMHNADVDPKVQTESRPWITDPGSGATEYFTFNTPIGAAPDKQCGRAVFSDVHVGAASSDYPQSPFSFKKREVPSGCANNTLSPQEKALEFMLFDLASCVQPDTAPPAPPPRIPPPPR